MRNGLGVSPTNSSNKYDIYSLVVDYDLNFATLTSATSKSNIEETAATSCECSSYLPQNPEHRLITFYTTLTTSSIGFSQELRLTSTSDNISWTLGLFYDDLEDDFSYGLRHFIVLAVPISISTSTAIIDGSSTSTSVFGNISYNISDKVTV